MTEQNIPDRDGEPDPGNAGEEPVIPDEGFDAVPPDQVDPGPGSEPTGDAAATEQGL